MQRESNGFEIDSIDAAVGGTINKLAELTPEMFERLHEAYTHTFLIEAYVGIVGWGIALLFLIGLVVFSLIIKEYILAGCLVGLCIISGAFLGAYTIQSISPEAKATTFIYESILKASRSHQCNTGGN